MKLLIVGAGSIGSRYARLASAFADVLLFDTDDTRAAGVAGRTGVVACTSLEEALNRRPDAAIVATPHSNHVVTAMRLIEAGCHVLVEKPISDRIEPARQLVDKASSSGRCFFVACNIRFHPGPKTLKAHLARIGKPLFARAYFGQWLPDMRPHADYRTLYCARSGEGGGVVLDAIHEIDCLVWMFGTAGLVAGSTARLSDLEIDAEDYATMSLRHDNGVRSEIHLDYLQHCKRRGCEIVGSEGTMLWESENTNPEHCRVRLFRGDQKTWENLFESHSVDADRMYVELLDAFLAAAHGEAAADILDGPTALDELEIALAARSGPDENGGN